MNMPLLALKLNLEPWKKRMSTSHMPVSFCTLLEILNSICAIFYVSISGCKGTTTIPNYQGFLAYFWRDNLKLA